MTERFNYTNYMDGRQSPYGNEENLDINDMTDCLIDNQIFPDRTEEDIFCFLKKMKAGFNHSLMIGDRIDQVRITKLK